ncbi:hypothetical protein JR316_0004762 [Psilocybe cubensis]|uniref:Uncharacterized protein n=2 Tax=Psilocybe cubensis TaxID=181762 RepID=A0ACB8H4N7_PSICU|nr:hypothetical protein JR316_0004762 [Psilocybe cubensis]KAH9482662.1 hypothetical protein JR316_0004762 [Psilocybe cubensis]
MEVKDFRHNKRSLDRNDNDRINKGLSYITAISALGFVVGLLFFIKWAYVSHRRKSQRDALQSIWRDDFSVSSLPLWSRKRTLKSKKYVRSALLVGLFGSPAWETRYSATTNKVSRSRPQIGWPDSFPAKESSQYKALSVKSVRNAFVNTTDTNRGTGDVHHLRADNHKPDAFSATPELPLPLPVMELHSGMKRSRHSENMNSPRIMCWKNAILSKKHTSYPSGLWIEKLSSGPIGNPQTPSAESSFTASFNVLGCSKDTVSENTDPQTSDIPRCLVSIESEVALPNPQHTNSSEPKLDHEDTCYLSKNAILNTGKKGLNVHLSGGLMDLERQIPLPCTSYQGDLQPMSFWVPNLSPFTLTNDTSNALNGSEYHSDKRQSSKQARSVLPVKERLPSRSPKIGPSPLRRMFLPADDTEVNETDNTSAIPTSISDNNRRTQFPWAHTSPEALIPFSTNPISLNVDGAKQPRNMGSTGLGISSTVSKISYNKPPVQRLAFVKEPRTDSDTDLLYFLEELVQETSEWEPDMFLDDNFKVMIDSSKSFGLCAPTRVQRSKSTPSRKHRMSYVCLEDIPEVDITENSHSPNADEDHRSYWSDEEAADRDVGIAC